MGRSSTIDALPVDVRKQLEHKLLTERKAQIYCLAWLHQIGYDEISKSALNRYAVKLFTGVEDLKLMAVYGQPLSEAVAEVVAEADPKLAELMNELISLQIRQQALTVRIRKHLYDRRGERDAKAWVEETDTKK